MQKNISLNLIAGATVAVIGLISIPAHAQNNQSDVTGNNVFNNPVPVNNQSDVSGNNVFNHNLPNSFEGNTVSKETAEQAEQLSQKLRDAYRNCNAGEGCVEFNNLLQESNTFLSNINQQVEAVGNSQGSRAW
ncbi:hypothetical protein IQ247_04650 [Plectonema cf. radiosum LEGE 06105]|uniref:Uncharacterized protein n=1 Tax=Plectonema cf. radiosum LEGE 06105 TaxID=945769 RepID=A0A8J7EY90_9CYAN|nr:hypothetical protein [Plectonema radiosum]MBE9212008.1 hypothetical protein [Plectonema cf. radiosum LEGE 06105]